MWSCLVDYVKKTVKRGGATHLESEWLSNTSVRWKCIPRKFMKTSWKPFVKKSPFYSTVNKWEAELKRGRGSVEDDGRSGRLEDAIADEYVKVVHTLVLCDWRRDLRSIAREVGISF